MVLKYIWSIILVCVVLSDMLKTDACPNSYLLTVGRTCYWVTEQRDGVENSSENCRAEGGELAIIPNSEINSQLLNHFKTFSSFPPHLWIGVNDSAVEGNYVYSNGSGITWSNWKSGEPNDPRSDGHQSQDYVVIETSTMKWLDIASNFVVEALCFAEIATTSTTASTTTTTRRRRITTTSKSTTSESTTTTITTTQTTQTRSTTSATEKTQFTTNTEKTGSTKDDSTLSLTSHETTKDFEDRNSTATISTVDQKDESRAQILVPIVIAVVLVTLVVVILVIIALRRYSHKRKEMNKDDIDMKQKEDLGQNSYMQMKENMKPDATYGELEEGQYDILNQKRNQTLNNDSGNLYSHTNVKDDTYDTSKVSVTNTKPENYDDLGKNKFQGNNDKTHSKGMHNESQYSEYAEVGGENKVYHTLEKESDQLDNTYGETLEGEYDILNKRRKKLENNMDQIYSHTNAGDDMYDATVVNKNSNSHNETYDSFRDVRSDENFYDHT